MNSNIIDRIVWWIPFKQLRNDIRELLEKLLKSKERTTRTKRPARSHVRTTSQHRRHDETSAQSLHGHRNAKSRRSIGYIPPAR